MFQENRWRALRLGGSGMPDVIATDMDYNKSFIVECKSGYSDRLYVPLRQIYRQYKWIEEAILPVPRSLLAFKFAQGQRPITWFWLMADGCQFQSGLTCRRDGAVMETGTDQILGYCLNSLELML